MLYEDVLRGRGGETVLGEEPVTVTHDDGVVEIRDGDVIRGSHGTVARLLESAIDDVCASLAAEDATEAAVREVESTTDLAPSVMAFLRMTCDAHTA